MGNFSWKKLLLIGFIIVLLVSIPLTLYLVKQRQNSASHATASTTLAFSPTSSSGSPVSGAVGQPVSFDIMITPGNNLVSFVRMEIKYDPAVLSIANNGFQPDLSTFPTVLEGPTYASGTVNVSLSIGADDTKAINSVQKVGTITFTPTAQTNGQPTEIQFTSNSSALSIAGPNTGSNDQYNENVLSSTNPAFVQVGSAGSISITPGGGTITITATPVPGGTGNSTPTPTSTQSAIATPTTIVVAESTPTLIPTVAAQAPTSTDTPTLAATGSTNITIGVGVVLTIVTILGAAIFFML